MFDSQSTLLTRHASKAALSSDTASPPTRSPKLAGGSPIQGHLRDLAESHHALFQRCAELGGIAHFRIYWYTCHVVTDPDLVSSVLIDEASSFHKTRALKAAEPTFGNGLVTSEGETWKRQQRLLRPFFTPRAAAGYEDLMASAIQAKLDTWRSGQTVDLYEEMVDVSLEIVCSALFGIEAGRLQPLIRGAAHAVQRWHRDCEALCLPYPHYWPTAANFRYRRATRSLDRAVYALIREARASSEKDHGLLSAMLRVQDEDGQGIRDAEVRDQIVTLFLAGHDTTASSLAFALYELSHRTDLQSKIVDELESTGDSPCLTRVLEETLRLYPAVHLVARTAIRDVMLGSYLIREGEEVVIPLAILQRSPKFFRSPDTFDPDRWLDAAKASPRGAHIPFSTGPRVCTGRALAMQELRTILATVLRRFRIDPIGERAPRIDARMTLGPAPGSTMAMLGSHVAPPRVV